MRYTHNRSEMYSTCIYFKLLTRNIRVYMSIALTNRVLTVVPKSSVSLPTTGVSLYLSSGPSLGLPYNIKSHNKIIIKIHIKLIFFEQ